jgi:two-component system CheB/CheR fusion protein
MKKSKSSKSKSQNGSAKKREHDDFLIVGIGASAGGIQALKTFFGSVPADSGAAYVVILHLSPEHESHLAEVLQTNARISVTQVTERVKVEPNHVFVVSPNQSLAMADGHIVVSPVKTIEERRAPVDIFFRTLAETHHEQAVCVVLSGTGADGSMGLKRVKENGGAVFVQNPRETEYSDMVRNAIATDLVDEVLNVADIPAKIVEYRENLKAVALPVQPEARPEEQQKALRDVFTQLRVHTGHDFSNYKRPTILRRIERRISVRNLSGIAEYAAYLKKQPEEVQALLKDLLISVTNFFRDKEAFAALEHDIIPRVAHEKKTGDQIRVWVAGCATGEEAYSLAMLLAERLDGGGIDQPEIQIFASDIDEAAIAAAREGFYTLNDAADVSPERLRRFFTKEGDGYRVRRDLRERVLFANHNVLKDPPFSRLDLVTCRNMLIYLNQAAQKRVMETFHFALKPSGFLFLGASESIDGSIDVFAPLSKENNIFQSRNVESRIPRPVRDSSRNESFTARLEFLQTSVQGQVVVPTTTEQDSAKRIQAQERLSYADLHRQLLEQFAPPSVVVNEEYDILHLSERAGRFMQIQGGEPSNNLLKIIRPELRLELRNALYQAAQNRRSVEAKNLTLKIDDRSETINIHVRPVLRAEDTARGFILVLFEKTDDAPATDSETLQAFSESVAGQLEEELVRVKAQLRSSSEQYEIQTEELRASNEELQALNEELRSSSEELETGKEELQSVNEELQTVNQELEIKIEEISLSSNNLQNLVNSTDIGTIFLDRNFRVQLFTPAAREIFNLIATDFGRLLSDITHRLADDNLLRDAEAVLEKLHTVEREVRTVDNRVWTMRVLPYRTADDRIQGTVITFFDITERQRASEKVRESEEKYRALFDSIDYGLATLELMFDENEKVVDYRFVQLNDALTRMTGLSPEILGKPVSEAIPGLEKEWFETFERVAKTGEPIYFELYAAPVGKWFECGAARIGGAGSPLISAIYNDITERKRAEEARFYLAAIVESLEDSMLTVDFKGTITSWNNAAEQLYGYPASEAVGKPLAMLTLPADLAEVLHNIEKIKHSRQVEIYDTVQVNKDGREMNLEVVLSPIKDSSEAVIGISTIARDVTERLRREAELKELNRRIEQQSRVFSTTLSGISDFAYIFDRDGRFVYSNKPLLDLLGITLEEIIGKNFFDLNYPEDLAARLQKQIRQVFDTREIVRDETPFTSPAGKPGFYEYIFTPVFAAAGGAVESVAGSTRDVTERKQAEESLRFQAKLLDTVEQAAIATDLDGKIIYWNRFAEQLYGWTAKEATGRNIVDVAAADTSVEQAEEIMSQVREGKSWTGEFNVKRRDGSTFPALVIDSPINDTEGNLIGIVGVSVDITERKRTETAVRESETRFRAIVNQATAAIAEFDLAGNYTLVNETLCDLLGYTEAEFLQMNQRDITHPEDLPRCLEAFEQAIATGKASVSEKRVIRKDGSIVWITESISSIADAGSKPQRVAMIAFDITARKRIETAAREAEEHLRIAVDAAEMGTWDWNLERNEVFWNERHFTILGMKPRPNPLPPEAFFDRVHPEDRERVGERLKQAIETDGTFQAEFRFLREDTNETCWAEGYGHLVEKNARGAPVRMSGVMSDITERRRAEESLLTSKERLRLLIESASDHAIFTVTLDNRINSWNAGAEKIFGWTESEALGQSGEIIFTPKDRAKGEPKKEIATALAEGRAPDERFHLRRDGSRFYSSGVMNLLRDADGNAQGFVKIARDMTERIHAEKALRDREILQKLVGAQEDERRRIARDLHDHLGQQLTALKLKLEATGKVCEDAEVSGRIDEMSAIAKQIDADVDFLAWELRPAALDDLGLLTALENYLKEWMRHTGIKAEFYTAGLKNIRLAPEVETNLYRIAQEALNNVYKHAAARNANVMIERRGSLIVLIVEDDGIGFDTENKQTKEKGIGLLGMGERGALVGGKIQIESTADKGTTIFVRIPIEDKATRQVEE